MGEGPECRRTRRVELIVGILGGLRLFSERDSYGLNGVVSVRLVDVRTSKTEVNYKDQIPFSSVDSRTLDRRIHRLSPRSTVLKTYRLKLVLLCPVPSSDPSILDKVVFNNSPRQKKSTEEASSGCTVRCARFVIRHREVK